MNNVNRHIVNGFTYHVDTIQEVSNRHRGQIYIVGREDTGETYSPPKIICTPTTFKTARAAIIEAESYCYEVFHNGDLDGLLAVTEFQRANGDYIYHPD
ncbi:hypothetical protein O0880_14525 [Janthinobacterium sp. SUN118]|uniref:hypothetical protein n=1 Tax=Janthinobacterium sp. SUN118 TaxID=3004100 RepID=UPI0025B22A73|nr:hypothetical protein [Janthinobacterium sp. SUN118]MDN2710637.1 hypothetical protein [Janthinobacterium sp. SUN118]